MSDPSLPPGFPYKQGYFIKSPIHKYNQASVVSIINNGPKGSGKVEQSDLNFDYSKRINSVELAVETLQNAVIVLNNTIHGVWAGGGTTGSSGKIVAYIDDGGSSIRVIADTIPSWIYGDCDTGYAFNPVLPDALRPAEDLEPQDIAATAVPPDDPVVLFELLIKADGSITIKPKSGSTPTKGTVYSFEGFDVTYDNPADTD